MTTPLSFRQAIRAALDDHEGDRDAQVTAVEGITARAIEAACRPPSRHFGPVRKQQEARRSA